MTSKSAHKRHLNSKEEEKNNRQSDSRSQKSKSSDSFLETLFHLDSRCTEAFALCATSDSSFGFLRPLMKFLEITCHGVPWLIGTVGVFVCLHKPEDIELLVNLFLALIFDLIVVGLSKAIVRRPRPVSNKMDMFATVSVDKFSFPSGHTTRAVMLMCFFIERVLQTPLPVILVIVWAVCVSISRILLGRHHISDVICGFLIGLLEYAAYSMFWVPQEKCLDWLEIYFGHVHL